MLAIGGALILLFLRPDPMQLREDDLQPQADTRSVPLLTIFARRPVQVAVLALIIGQLVMVVLMVLTPLHMDRQEHGPGLISAVVMAHTLGMYGLSGVTGWLVDRFGRHAVIFAGGSLLVAAAILTPAANSVPLLAFALFLLGLGWNFCFVAGSSLLANAVTNRERGSVQGASDTLVAVASGAGSLSAGLLYEDNGMIVPGGAGVALASLLLGFTLFVMWRRTKPIGMATTQDS
jgi:MFS family permease